jgi:hypothetical protein
MFNWTIQRAMGLKENPDEHSTDHQEWKVTISFTAEVSEYPVKAKSETEAKSKVASKLEDLLTRDYEIENFEIDDSEVWEY